MKKRHRHLVQTGLPPGTPVYVGEPRQGGVEVQALIYDSDDLVVHHHPLPAQIRALVHPGRVVWLDCDGVHDAELAMEICDKFGVHPVAIEDIVTTGTRPKTEPYEEFLLVVAEMVTIAEDDPSREMRHEHISIILGHGFVLSFQEGKPGDLFESVRNRIQRGHGRIRRMAADYLLHGLLDAIVDGYFAILEHVEDKVDEVEALAFEDADATVPTRVHALKQELAVLRRSVWPLREAVARLLKGDSRLLSRDTEPYFRDLYDHVVQVMENIDASRERLTGVLDLHLAVTSHRMNEVMRVLTIVATVFIPLSFLAGLWGMNFQYMPELQQEWGYPMALVIMGGSAAAMFLYFYRKGWL